MNTVVVNGKKYTVPNGSVSVIGNKVYVDGKLITDESGYTSKEIKIVINGNVEGEIKVDSGHVIVFGECKDINTMSGDVECRNVNGNIKTQSGNVKCGNVSGDISTMSGDVTTKRALINIS